MREIIFINIFNFINIVNINVIVIFIIIIIIITKKLRTVKTPMNKNLIYLLYSTFFYSSKLSENAASICKFTPLILWNKMIAKYFHISLIDIMKLLMQQNQIKANYAIWNTESSNNCCEYKFLLSDGLCLLISKLSFNSSKYLLHSLPRNLWSSCNFMVTGECVIPNRVWSGTFN